MIKYWVQNVQQCQAQATGVVEQKLKKLLPLFTHYLGSKKAQLVICKMLSSPRKPFVCGLYTNDIKKNQQKNKNQNPKTNPKLKAKQKKPQRRFIS